MKKYLLLLLSSVIGGFIAVYTYEKLNSIQSNEENRKNLIITEQIPANNVISSATLLQDRPDFVEIAEKNN